MYRRPDHRRLDEPRRSLGPGLISGELHEIWIYIAAPVLGAAIGAFAYQLVRGEHLPQPPPQTERA